MSYNKENDELQSGMPSQGYPDHPMAAAFPMMDDVTFDERVEDLGENASAYPS